jgi:tRNA A-37 threonylcarbamoyl transferase component Bud32
VTQQTDRLNTALAGRYRIERELGQGGMATVYAAHDLKHDRKVALKLLKPELAAVLGADRFVVEIKTTASLQHPHILPLFDSGTADGFLFYVMPFIEGETLRDKLNRETQLGVDEAVRIAREVLDALQYAHEHGIVHRDVKPENILLHGGHAMVVDFGIALAVSAAAGGRMTETGLSLGTPHYMSPEQATAEKEITARSDVYSLGSVLYEMLTGQPPHLGGSAQQIIMKIVTETPRPVTELRKSVPSHVEAAVMTSLEKLPADRFASAADFARALGNPSRITWQYPSRSGAPPAAARGNRWLTWATAAGALIVTGVAVAIVARRPAAVPRAPLRFVLASTPAELMQDLSISADGRTIAYSATVDGAQRSFVRRLDALDAVQVPGAAGVFVTALTADGRTAAVAESNKQISLVPLDGGGARQIAALTLPAGLSWSTTRGLVVGMPAFSPDQWGLTLLPAGTAQLKVLTNPKPKAMHHDPLVLDDGITVLYLEIPVEARGVSKVGALAPSRLGIGNLETNTWHTTDFVMDGIVGYSNGILVYRDGATVKAVRFDVKRGRLAGEPVVIEGLPAGIDNETMAANGTMVFHVVSAKYELELVDETGSGQPVNRDTLTSLTVRLSPDGKQAAILENQGAGAKVRVLDLASRGITNLDFRGGYGIDWMPGGREVVVAGRGVRSVRADQADGTGNRWLCPNNDASCHIVAGVTISPDGKAMVVGTMFGEGFNLMVRRFDTDSSVKPLVATQAMERAPRFSPDGRWLAYSSDQSGREEVYIQPFPGPGRRVQVSADGGEQPTWSADGRLFYRAGKAMMVAQLTRSAETASVASRRKLFEGDFYGLGEFAATYDVSADGRHFLMGRRIGAGGGQVIAWVDWLGEIESRLDKVPKK